MPEQETDYNFYLQKPVSFGKDFHFNDKISSVSYVLIIYHFFCSVLFKTSVECIIALHHHTGEQIHFMKLLAAIMPQYYGRLLAFMMGLNWPHDSNQLHSHCIFDCAKIRESFSKERHI